MYFNGGTIKDEIKTIASSTENTEINKIRIPPASFVIEKTYIKKYKTEQINKKSKESKYQAFTLSDKFNNFYAEKTNNYLLLTLFYSENRFIQFNKLIIIK